jgi:plasmid maintenance system antidote protein VapI
MNELADGLRRMTPSTALRLASAAFWMNLQLRWELYHARQVEGQQFAAIEPCHAP